ncbi:MAG: UDP-glucose--hexose-1-phosphate uridylyltransferase [Eubacteriales bacterium]|nr:UDP-glucose--hexose-1-phosphate uridylyltransferase [Eubacteriales bacterium]
MNKVYAAIGALTNYAISHGLAEEADRHYLVNALLEKLGLDDYETVGDVPFQGLDDILDTLVDYAAEQGLLKSESITGRDLFDTALMGVVTPRPSEVIRTFRSLYGESPEKATDWFYRFSQDTNYIRATRVAKDIRWSVPSEFGDIDISINLSKPEKDPRDIAAAKTAKQSAYPKCQLCLENEGYAGRMDHPARQNHRIIPVTINESHWGFQYSPYVYYNEHCIVLNGEHVPMKIDRAAFRKLFDFVGQFPHYFLGSNADLPIVGGSILSHDHFQGGRYEFAMAKAPYESKFTVPGYEDVEAGIVHWPLSVIRLRGEDDGRIIDLADHILQAWRGYTDEAAFIFAETDGEPHNTITPIARKRDGKFELDLALRNNITTDECPLGVYHPHAEYHHIKKENIGLIEVMGLAILPARLKTEMALLAECLTGDKKLEDYPELEQHAEWAKDIAARRADLNKDNVDDILKEEIGHVFVHVLEDAGVYKCTDEGRAAFRRFIATL